MRGLRRGGLVASTIAVLTLSGAALAARPISNGGYKGNKVIWSVSGDQKSMSFSTTYCHGTQGLKFGGIKISSSGKFRFNGTDEEGRKAVISGKYVTSKKAKGSVTIKGCSAHSFTAKYFASG